jgi:D-tyrosyl-tRNA(Tyr) deacylase
VKAILQRATEARLYVENIYKGSIGKGIVVFIGIGKGDKEEKIEYLVRKILLLRIFEDENGKMNYSISDIKGEIMVVSQFTLYGDCRKGNRPDFTMAEDGKLAEEIYNKFLKKLKESNLKIVEGEFGKKMLVEIHNDGPCTLILEK